MALFKKTCAVTLSLDCCAWRTARTWGSWCSRAGPACRCPGSRQSPRRSSAVPRTLPEEQSQISRKNWGREDARAGSLIGSRHWILKKKTNGLVLFCLYIVTTPARVASMLQVIGGWSHRANQLLSGPEQTLYRWTGSGDSLATQACRHLIPMWFWLTSTYTQNS